MRRLAQRAADSALTMPWRSTAGMALYFVAGEIHDGGALMERALALNPNLAAAWLFIGWAKVWNGDPEPALAHLAQAMRLSPRDPQFAMMEAATACAHFFAGREEEATDWARTSVLTQPDYRLGMCILAASLGSAGKSAEAGEVMDRLRRIDPALRLSTLRAWFPIRRPEHVARWTEGLRRAGLPE